MIDFEEASRRTDKRLERIIGDEDYGDVPIERWRFMAIGTDVPSHALIRLLEEDLAAVRDTLVADPEAVANVIAGRLLCNFWLGYEFGKAAD